MNEFEWPCDLRIAHGPHDVYGEFLEPDAYRTCPGVRAHPDTMIGRQHHA